MSVPRGIFEILDSTQRKKLVPVISQVKKEMGTEVRTYLDHRAEMEKTKKTSDFDNMFKSMKDLKGLERKLSLSNGSGTYLESLPIEIAMRLFFNSEKALLIGQILLKLSGQRISTSLPEC